MDNVGTTEDPAVSPTASVTSLVTSDGGKALEENAKGFCSFFDAP